MGCGDRVGNCVNQIAIRRTCLHEMVEGPALVETRHFDGVFNRGAVPANTQRSVGAPRNRDDATVDLGSEVPVYADLLLAGGFSLCQRRVIQEGKGHGSLDLQCAVTLKKTRRGMRIDPVYVGMPRGV